MALSDIRAAAVNIIALCDALDAGATPPPPPVLTVAAGGNIQAAIDAATPGTTIRVALGAFPGVLTLRAKVGLSADLPIIIRPDCDDAQLPASVRPTARGPDLVVIQGGPTDAEVIRCEAGAGFYTLIGLTVTTQNPSGTLVAFGEGNETSVDQLPHDLTLDRCTLDGQWACKRGLALNGVNGTIVNSLITGIMKPGQDSQCVCGWNGPGPFSLQNCLFDSGTEIVMFGGSMPSIPNLIPSNIEIGGCYLSRNVAQMRAVKSTVKTCLELKNAQHVHVHGCVIENCWVDEQTGLLLDLTVRAQGPTAPWSTLNDILIENCVVRHGNQGAEILGLDDQKGSDGVIFPSTRAQTIVLRNLYWSDIGGPTWGASATRRWLYVVNGPIGVSITQQTVVNSPVTVGLGIDPGASNTVAAGLTVENLLNFPEGKYNIAGNGTPSMGLPSWTAGVDPASVFDYVQAYRSVPTNKWTYPGAHTSIVTDPTTAPMIGSDGNPVGCDLAALKAEMPDVDLTA